MGKKLYRKVCGGCLREFVAGASKNCPACGSDTWNYVDKSGRVRIPVVEAMATRRYPADGPLSPRRDEWIEEALRRWHPVSVGGVL